MIKGKVNQDIYQANHYSFTVENIRENLKERHIWEVPHIKTSYREDNYSDDEDEFFVEISGNKISKNKSKQCPLKFSII